MRVADKKWWALFLLLLTTPPSAYAGVDSVEGSGHDLSIHGPGPVKSTNESRVCLFCHASHIDDPNPPKALWNQKLSTITSYAQYTSSTYKQTNNPISTRSKLCLSCHDGTVAIGQNYSNYGGTIPVQGALAKSDNLGSDLSGDHPFGFSMPAVDDGEISLSLVASPPSVSDRAVRLYNNKIECVTCHDPHKPNFDSVQQFLVRSNVNGALCTACHDTSRGALAGWPLSQHAVAANVINRGALLPYSTVAANACMSCHKSHNKSGPDATLLRDGQENTCINCHGGSPNASPTLRNIAAEIGSTYSHPIGLPAAPPHDPSERLPVNSSRHSECADCHNPHAAQATDRSSPPAAQPSLAGVSGLSAAGNIVKSVQNEYEVCFKCHADSTNKPQSSRYGLYGREPVRTTTSIDPFNVRLDLNSAVARHNVVQPARPGVAPSLRANMLDLNGNPAGRSLITSAYLYCSDCHNNDAARSSGGSAPNGPHGSKWAHLLERQFQENSLPALGPGTNFAGIVYVPSINGPYALCDKCHDLDNKLNLSGGGLDAVFGHHRSHVANDGASCSVCHAAHGVQNGTELNNKHLVDFDTQIVAPSRGNLQPYIDTSHRECFLTCHGVAHNGTSY